MVTATRLRPAERGAALLVVVLVITLLSAVGLFAMRSASLVDSATGYNRQLIQTSAMAELAVHAAAAAISAHPQSLVNELDAQQSPSADGPPRCKATAAIPGTPCVAYDSAYIFNHKTDATIATLDALPGFLGQGETRADFHVEVFSLAPSGYWTSGKSIDDKLLRVAVQAEARIRPITAVPTSTTCSTTSAPATSVQRIRATIRFDQEGF